MERCSCRCRFGSEGGGTATWRYLLSHLSFRIIKYYTHSLANYPSLPILVCVSTTNCTVKTRVCPHGLQPFGGLKKMTCFIMFPTHFDHVKIFGIISNSQSDSFVEVLAPVRHRLDCSLTARRIFSC